MTISVTLSPDLEQRVLAASKALNVPVEDYLVSLVEADLHVIKPAPLAGESNEEFRVAMTMLRRPGEKPLYPDETWSRATIYQDHD